MAIDRPLFSTLLVYSFTLLLLYLLYSVISPFLGVLVWAGAIGVITLPLHKKILSNCNFSDITAAFLITAGVVTAVIIPLVGLIFSLSREAALAYQYLDSRAASGSVLELADLLNTPSVIIIMEKIRPFTSSLNIDLDAVLLPTVKKGIAAMLNYSTGILKDFFGLLFKLILIIITLFFIYKDGSLFLERFWSVIIIREGLKKTILDTIRRVLYAVMYGIVLTSVIQGILGGLGFWVAGLPAPILFGALMTVCALIPIIGTAVIWIPGAIYLLVQGDTIYALLLVAWCAVVVSSIDNIIRPLFISGVAKLHILIVVFGVLGGVLAFGITGVVAGPVILALFIVFFQESRVDGKLKGVDSTD
ncbi:MAG: AI-2E family transporter [Desulfuromonadaceae bacterium]|nr:AI-2E family transporter [Desulfuromonadaceae bacterium]MDD2855711.1 AI-2E family transporter [Desulfuromonadaceae bacterium]